MTEKYGVMVIGDGGVGKSAITIQYIKQIFVDEYDPTIEDTFRTHLEVDNKHCFLEITDTSGQEEYRLLRQHQIRMSDGYLLVFSLVNTTSFENVKKIHYKDIELLKEPKTPCVILIGNKADLHQYRTVSESSISEFVSSSNINIKYFETSAENRTNINECFEELIRVMRSANPHFNDNNNNHHHSPRKSPRRISNSSTCLLL